MSITSSAAATVPIGRNRESCVLCNRRLIAITLKSRETNQTTNNLSIFNWGWGFPQSQLQQQCTTIGSPTAVRRSLYTTAAAGGYQTSQKQELLVWLVDLSLHSCLWVRDHLYIPCKVRESTNHCNSVLAIDQQIWPTKWKYLLLCYSQSVPGDVTR